jgi:hypothetical protein
MRARFLATALLIVAACAHTYPLEEGSRPVEDDRITARGAEQRAQQLEQSLSEASAGTAPPACSRVCELVGQICVLSRNICALSGQHPGDSELADRCASGEQRCRRSRDRVPPGCSCPAP